MISKDQEQNIFASETNTEAFLLKYQDLIDIIIKKYIRSGRFHCYEIDDIKQSVAETLIHKKDKILSQFLGNAQFESYLSVVIKNICNGIVRKDKKHSSLPFDPDYSEENDCIDPEQTIILKQELQRLDWILRLYHKKRNKLVLCLKLRYRIPVSIKDFKVYISEIKKPEIALFHKETDPYHSQKDNIIFRAVIKIFNKHEKKSNTSDSLRKYIQTRTNELIKLLNGSPPTSNYNEETLQILFEKYIEAVKTGDIKTSKLHKR